MSSMSRGVAGLVGFDDFGFRVLSWALACM